MLAESVLWACIVYENDVRFLPDYLSTVLEMDSTPAKVVVIDTGKSETIRCVAKCFEKTGPCPVKYTRLSLDLGFNPGLNEAISQAVVGDYAWLATMTVRAKPEKNWLLKSVEAGVDPNVGMVSTVHLNPNGKIDCLGHVIGSAGECLDFGEDVTVQDLRNSFPGLDESSVWAPCSGGALYRTAALSKAMKLAPDRLLVRSRTFKSYNCDVLGYFIRSVEYKNAISFDAVCKRNRTGSSSRLPNTPGLLINQEINRIANIFEFWPEDMRSDAIKKYLNNTNRKSGLQEVDLKIACALGEATARGQLYDRIGMKTQSSLNAHVKFSVQWKQYWKGHHVTS